jgi:hypothetical protein
MRHATLVPVNHESLMNDVKLAISLNICVRGTNLRRRTTGCHLWAVQFG